MLLEHLSNFLEFGTNLVLNKKGEGIIYALEKN